MGGTYRSARLPVRGPPATGRFCQKSGVGGRLSEKPTVGGRLRKKKGRRRGKEKKKEEGKKEYLASAVLARLPSPPAGRLRAVACARSQPGGRDRDRFFSRAGRRSQGLHTLTHSELQNVTVTAD
ncbi:hypothetical protein BHM03_00040455 [Ensete ventricosum]|nr:hypothetical protein BHM03_00040455 [Ensete ventricosum]